jgi:hypothetical protein
VGVGGAGRHASAASSSGAEARRLFTSTWRRTEPARTGHRCGLSKWGWARVLEAHLELTEQVSNLALNYPKPSILPLGQF